MKEYIITASEEGQTLIKYLDKTLPGAKGGVIFKALRKKNILVNGLKASGKEVLRAGDSVKVFFSDEVIGKFGAAGNKNTGVTNIKKEDEKEFSRNIIYEDDNILIVNKWDNIISQPDGSKEVSLNDLLLNHLKHISKVYAVKPSVCNRLDRNTTGLVLCGKTQKGLRFLSDILKDRSLKKYYYAVVCGNLDKSLSLGGYLYKDRLENKAVITTEDEIPGSSPVRTDAEPVSHIRVQGTELTLVKIHLITGKPHQIRAHMLYAGYPVMGDIKYCTEESLRSSGELDIKRQLLHALKIEFPTVSGDMAYLSGKTFEAPVSRDMLKLMKYKR